MPSPKTKQKKKSAAPRFARRRSSIHGFGVFALQDIPRGIHIVEYKGEWIPPGQDAPERNDGRPENHTFLFSLSDGATIDAAVQGNSARFINHSCNPNCEADEVIGRDRIRMFYKTLRKIPKGTELTIDYQLIREKGDRAKDYPCFCGTRQCRHTLLAPR